jgi:hypothetical protein
VKKEAMIKFIMSATLKEFVDPALSTLLLNQDSIYCSMLNNCSVSSMGPTVRDQFLEKPSYSSFFGSAHGRGKMVSDAIPSFPTIFHFISSNEMLTSF